MSNRRSVVVISAAALVGVALAGVARAVLPRAVLPAAIVAHEESEAAEPRPMTLSASSDNPYDDPAPTAHAGLARISVPSQDGMLRIPGGRIMVGSSNPKAPANERPAHSATVAPFWLDRTEVTVGAYRACVQAGACSLPARSSATCTYAAGQDDLPVSCVHWADAEAYCRFAKKRLPTEVEWEDAARGTLAVPYPWGGPPSCSNAVTLISERTGRTCAPGPAPVGSHPSGDSVFGVQDLSGNVEEWTADWYVETTGPGPSARAGAAHVLRGGGWLSPPSLSRTTTRDWGSAMESGPNMGFRCARSE
jgi:formylglycine-generating enzyme required for sulfatase activity